MILGLVIAATLTGAPASEAAPPPGAQAFEEGLAYLEGDGVPQDQVEAVRHFRRSAELGHPLGQVSLAVMLATGNGVAENDVEAREWYARAVDQRSAHALCSLGAMLILGEGGDVDLATGLAYVELSAEVGNEVAVKLLKDFAIQAEPEGRAEVDAIKAEWIAKHGPPLLDE